MLVREGSKSIDKGPLALQPRGCTGPPNPPSKGSSTMLTMKFKAPDTRAGGRAPAMESRLSTPTTCGFGVRTSLEAHNGYSLENLKPLTPMSKGLCRQAPLSVRTPSWSASTNEPATLGHVTRSLLRQHPRQRGRKVCKAVGHGMRHTSPACIIVERARDQAASTSAEANPCATTRQAPADTDLAYPSSALPSLGSLGGRRWEERRQGVERKP